jgi:uncharacterized lipoprotein YddW (UPF0748 family)
MCPSAGCGQCDALSSPKGYPLNKRKFLRTLGIGSVGLAVPTLIPSWEALLAKMPDLNRKYWAWLPTDLTSSIDSLKTRFALMRRAGIDAILPEVYDSRLAYFESAHLPVGEAWLEKILPLAKAEGLEVHAWIWSMPCNIREVRQQHPDWFAVNRRGESAAEKPAYVDYYRFLCPSHAEVHEFLKATVTELCQYRALDGIHLDYIRYPDVILPEALQPHYGLKQDREYPEFDYCYCNACRRDFKEETGLDPLTLEDPAANTQWTQFRYDRITHLVNDTVIPVAHAHKKSVTAAVFPNWEMVRQQWMVWSLDAVLPMLYHTFYNKGVDWIKEETEKGVRSLHGRAPLYSGIMVADLNPREFTQAIEAGLAGGANGVVLYHANAMTEAQWQVLSQVIAR